MSLRRLRCAMSVAACAFLAAFPAAFTAAGAQVSPDIPWLTIRTAHFRVHFTPALEAHARIAAANAERAYAQLAAELKPPRGPIELVIADNVDYTNGYATPIPSNRIVVYTTPPVDVSSLRFYDDWSTLIITHELVHIFHLDRAGGWWRLGQYIFGRSPFLMPNLYSPSWLTEGLAVYYESRLTGSGRLQGTDHGMIARAATSEGGPPRLDELSLVTTAFPGGQAVYAYGSLLVDHLARTRGPEKVDDFVGRMSRAPIPWLLDGASRRAFGITLRDAWREMGDSIRSEIAPLRDPLPGWTELTVTGRHAQHPRWLGDSALVYSANTGRDVPGAYTVGLNGRTRRVGRRNGLEPNIPLPDGSLLFAQLDFVDAYRVRSDLYIQRGTREHRLTRGARLSRPDARADGSIVAVQAGDASTRLVRVSADGGRIAPLTPLRDDTQWGEPRWSPDGSAIVAVRHSLDGVSSIVVLDTLGAVRSVVSSARAVQSSPAWSADGTRIFFSSDRGGSSQVYVAPAFPPVAVHGSTGTVLSDAATGVFQPEPARDADRIAAVVYRADGYHVGVAPLPPTAGADIAAAPDLIRRGAPGLPQLPPDTSRAERYSAWRTLLPTSWIPTGGNTAPDGGLLAGGSASGVDVIGRHAFDASVLVNLGSGAADGNLGYRYTGLASPVLGVGLTQEWDQFPVSGPGGVRAGWLLSRSRVAGVSASLLRPRYRSSASAGVGVELERVEFSSDPADLISRVTGFDSAPREFATLVASAGWSNTRRPSLSISPEDGISLSTSMRQQWRRGGDAPALRTIGVLRGFRSVNGPGYAHHVFAARIAGGLASEASTTRLSVGGTSGSSLELLPGYAVGGSARTFGVRGFPPGSAAGLRAIAGSAEYRFPLFQPTRGFRLLPFFFDRLSGSVYADAGAAWCPESAAARAVCRDRPIAPQWMISAGAEAALDAALQYDVPYRFRVGAAVPVRNEAGADVAGASLYFTLGYPF